ncbi:MAG: hypothetical protein IJC86_04660 [Clostridia bacterium]|nr:hypothetical protein [Clostridia bacterium]
MYEILSELGRLSSNFIGFLSVVLGCFAATAVFLLVVNPLHNYIKYYIADKSGDITVQNEGYLTMSHDLSFNWISFFSTLVLQMGFATPVIYEKTNFKKPKNTITYMALAGVGHYVCCSMVLLIIYSLLRYFGVFGVITATVPPADAPIYVYLYQVFFATVYFLTRICINSAILNMIPIVPMDMGDVLYMALNTYVADFFRNHQFFLSLVVIIIVFLTIGAPSGHIESLSSTIMRSAMTGYYVVFDWVASLFA